MQINLKIIFGLLIAMIISAISTWITKQPFAPFTIMQHGVITHPIEPLMLALIIGICIGNLPAAANKLKPGASFCSKTILAWAVILLGAQLNLRSVLSQAWGTLIIAMVLICSLYIINKILQRYWPKKWETTPALAATISSGVAICGSSAIAVLAPALKSKPHEVATSITIINLLGLIGVFLLPTLGHAMHMSQHTYGLWAGLSLPAVPQSVAAGFSYGAAAGTTATISKLMRVLCLLPVAIFFNARSNKQQPSKQRWYQLIPPMIIGFIILSLINSLGWISLANQHLPQVIHSAQTMLMTLAMAGMGLSTRFSDLKQCGRGCIYYGTVLTIIFIILCALASTLILN